MMFQARIEQLLIDPVTQAQHYPYTNWSRNLQRCLEGLTPIWRRDARKRSPKEEMQGSIAAAAHALGLPVADVQAMIARGDIEASPDGQRVPWREVSRLAQARPKEPVERRPVPEAWAGLADRLVLRPPATIDRIEDAARLLQIAFPADYIEFMTVSDGAEGVVGASYLQLWPVGDLVGLNRDYAVDEFVPGYVLFGSDGGGELFAFARESTSAPAPIVELPEVSMKPSEARARGRSFREFLSMLGEGRQ